MANWIGYIGIEIIDMTADQRQELVDVIKRIGKADNSPFPNLRMQIRVRLDSDAAIFEAVFDEDNLTVAQFKTWLGNIYSVDPSTITSTTQQTNYGPMATFARPANTPRLRMLLFGGVNADWETSRLATVAYLSANREDWEGAT